MTISDSEFEASFANLNEIYRRYLGRTARHDVYIDNLGIGRWNTDYYTLRVQGFTHDAALTERRRRIFEAAGIPDPGVSVAADPFGGS